MLDYLALGLLVAVVVILAVAVVASFGTAIYIVLGNRDPVPNEISACVQKAGLAQARSQDALSAVRADIAAASGSIFDQDALAEFRLDLRMDGCEHRLDHAARAEGHDDAYRAGRPFLCYGRKRSQCEAEQGDQGFHGWFLVLRFVDRDVLVSRT